MKDFQHTSIFKNSKRQFALFLIGLVLAAAGLITVGFFIGKRNFSVQKTSETVSVKEKEAILEEKEKEQKEEVQPVETIEEILYKNILGWPTMNSGLGFAFQYAPEFSNLGKYSFGGHCWFDLWSQTDSSSPSVSKTPRNVRIINYDSGSRRKAFMENYKQPLNNIKFVKEVIIDGSKSLIIGSAYNEYGEGEIFGVFIPKGNKAIIITESGHYDYNKKQFFEGEEWLKFLSTFKFTSSSISICPVLSLPPKNLDKKEFSDLLYHFSFQYPSSLKIYKAGSGQVNFVYLQDGWEMTNLSPSIIHISTFSANSEETLNDWLERHSTKITENNIYPQYKDIVNRKDYVLNGLETISFSGSYERYGGANMSGKIKSIVFVKKGNEVFHLEVSDSNFKQIFEEIVNSFH